MRAATILFTSAFVLFAMAGMAPALPAIERAFVHLPDAALLTRMVLTTTALFIALSAPVAGLLIDRVGRRPALLGALAVYAASATAPLWLDDLHAILATRAVLGVAAGVMMTTLTTLIGDFYEGPARNRMAGAQFAVMVLAMAAGTTVAGALADAGWRDPFWMYAAVVLALPMVAAFIREPVRARQTESAVPAAKPDVKIPLVAVGCLYALFWGTMVTTFVVPSQAPFLLREIGVPQATLAGLAVALFNLPAGVTAFAFRRLRERLSNAAILGGCLVVLGSGYLVAAVADSAALVLVGMVVAGFGFGPVMPTISAWLLGVAPPAFRGRLVGGLTFWQFMGLFCSPFVSQPLAEAVGMAGVFAMTGVFQIGAGAAFALAALALARRAGRA